eukprot:163868_1
MFQEMVFMIEFFPPKSRGKIMWHLLLLADRALENAVQSDALSEAQTESIMGFLMDLLCESEVSSEVHVEGTEFTDTMRQEFVAAVQEIIGVVLEGYECSYGSSCTQSFTCEGHRWIDDNDELDEGITETPIGAVPSRRKPEVLKTFRRSQRVSTLSTDSSGLSLTKVYATPSDCVSTVDAAATVSGSTTPYITGMLDNTMFTSQSSVKFTYSYYMPSENPYKDNANKHGVTVLSTAPAIAVSFTDADGTTKLSGTVGTAGIKSSFGAAVAQYCVGFPGSDSDSTNVTTQWLSDGTAAVAACVLGYLYDGGSTAIAVATSTERSIATATVIPVPTQAGATLPTLTGTVCVPPPGWAVRLSFSFGGITLAELTPATEAAAQLQVETALTSTTGACAPTACLQPAQLSTISGCFYPAPPSGVVFEVYFTNSSSVSAAVLQAAAASLVSYAASGTFSQLLANALGGSNGNVSAGQVQLSTPGHTGTPVSLPTPTPVGQGGGGNGGNNGGGGGVGDTSGDS